MRNFGLVFFLLLSALPACTSKKETAPPAQRVLNLAIWPHYLSPHAAKEFQEKTGIELKISNYSSNEEVLAKLQAGATGYDVIVPSDYMVSVMTKLGLIQELNRAKLPEFKNLDPKLLKKPFDPENRFSVPYHWGTTGIAIRKDLYAGKISSWKELFTSEELSGKFTLLDDVREVMAAALKAQGKSLNSKMPAELEEAKKLVLGAKKRIKAFTSEPLPLLVSGELAIAQAYSSDALQARKQTQGKVEYLIPSEGSSLWIDTLVIPKTAKNVEEAHAFINFLLEAKTNVDSVTELFGAPSVVGAQALLPQDLRLNPMLFPPEAVLKRAELMEDLGEAMTLWDRVWTEIKAD